MVTRRMPRVQSVVLPVLREELASEYPDLTVGSWYADVDHRTFPLLSVRRLGGVANDPARLDFPVLEMTAYTRDGLVATEDLYLDARAVILDMVERQRVTEAGYLHSFTEVMGPTLLSSPFEDTWRITGSIQVGLRPLRNQ